MFNSVTYRKLVKDHGKSGHGRCPQGIKDRNCLPQAARTIVLVMAVAHQLTITRPYQQN